MGPEFHAVRKVIHDSQKCHIIPDLIRIIQLGIIHLETLYAGSFVGPEAGFSANARRWWLCGLPNPLPNRESRKI